MRLGFRGKAGRCWRGAGVGDFFAQKEEGGKRKKALWCFLGVRPRKTHFPQPAANLPVPRGSLRSRCHQSNGYEMTQGTKPVQLHPPVVRSRFLQVTCFSIGGIIFLISAIFLADWRLRSMIDWKEFWILLVVFWANSAMLIRSGYSHRRLRAQEMSMLAEHDRRIAALFETSDN
jgi:hypothetical protein